MKTELSKRYDQTALLAELATTGCDVSKPKALRCPYHDDRTPSAGIYADSEGVWRFKCQSCGVGGDYLDLRARNTGKTVEDLIREESDAMRPKSEERIKTYPSIEAMTDGFPGVEAVYRYTCPETKRVEMFVVRVMKEGGKTFMQGKPVGDQFAWGAPPKPWPLYNRARIARAETVVVVEGEKCVHALHEVGIVATTSPGGAGKAEYADWSPLNGKRVVLWPDNDEAGMKHMDGVQKALDALPRPPAVCRVEPSVLEFSPKYDAADFIRDTPDHTGECVQSIIDSARSAGPAASYEKHLDEIISGKRSAVPWPWKMLDQATKALRPGCITLICGQPGAGKSYLLLSCMMFWYGRGIQSSILELEEDRNDYLQRMLAMRVGDSRLLDDEYIRDHAEQARSAAEVNREWINGIGRWLHDCPNRMMTHDDIIEWVRGRADAGDRIIVVDPITAAEQSAKPWIDDQRFIIAIKLIATEHLCSVILVTHPKLGQKNSIDLDQLAGGAAYPRFSQCVLVLEHHEDKESAVDDGVSPIAQLHDHNRTIYIRKARHAPGGGRKYAVDFSGKTLAMQPLGAIVRND